MTLQRQNGPMAHGSYCVDLQKLVEDYYRVRPEPESEKQRVRFGTSGHRGCSTDGTFNQTHLLAIAQAISEVRKAQKIDGPCFIGKDTHALSEPALQTMLEVLTANQVSVVVQANNGYTPTPVISHAILCHNRYCKGVADGLIVTPSHNPPHEGGIKYNQPHGGPADTVVTRAIERRANALIENGLLGVRRGSMDQARRRGLIFERDFCHPYVADLVNVVDMQAIQGANLKLAVDPMGGAGIAHWQHIADHYRIDLEVFNPEVDPTFSLIPPDVDGVIRMDCSSPHAMANVLTLRDRFSLVFANDPDHDRYGVVTPEGMVTSNHYMSVAIDYLLARRGQWSCQAMVGKSWVSSALIDRVVTSLNRRLIVMPVGFKWFVDGLYHGRICIAGEESSGASFLRADGRPWSTDKDGITACLLAAEITAVTGDNPHEYHRRLSRELVSTSYQRLHIPLSWKDKIALLRGVEMEISLKELAGYPVEELLVVRPPSGGGVEGVKVSSSQGWFALRPSGTEDLCKIYCESFLGEVHRQQIEERALELFHCLLQDGGGF